MALLTRIRQSGLVAALSLAGLVSAMSGAPAAAQGFGWFGNLFGGGAPRPAPGAPAYPGYGSGNGYAPRSPSDTYYDRPRHRATRRKPVEQVQREAPTKEKTLPPAKNASIFVDVLGDSLGQLLANGLDEALADREDIAVIHKARGSTGLVTADYYDWPKTVADLLAGREPPDAKMDNKADAKGADAKGADAKGDAKSEPRASDAKAADAKGGKVDGKPATGEPAETRAAETRAAGPKIDVAVMMIGSNDRQPMQVGGKTLQPGTPDWVAAYTKRVMSINEAFRARNVPLVWVGIPITKDDSFADSMAALNDIYREAAAKTGAIYVDTWEAFSDDNGDFSSYGPDINGQTVRLRSADGVHFTRAGARKLAHFVEAHVRRALEGKTPLPQLPTADVPDGTTQADRGPDGRTPDGHPGKVAAAARPDAGPIRNLNEPPSATSGALATLARGASSRDTDTAIFRGTGTPVPSGRADDARWSGTSAEP